MFLCHDYSSFPDFTQASEPASDVTKDVDLELPDVPTDKIKGTVFCEHALKVHLMHLQHDSS